MPDEQEKVPSFTDEAPANTLPDTPEPTSDPLANASQPETSSGEAAGAPAPADPEPLAPPPAAEPAEDAPHDAVRTSWAESRNILQ